MCLQRNYSTEYFCWGNVQSFSFQQTVINFHYVCRGNVQWLVWRSIIKILHHWGGNVCRGTGLLVYSKILLQRKYVKYILTAHWNISHFCGGNMWCGPVEYFKKLHHQQGIALLVCLNTFAKQMSEAHSDRSLKKNGIFAEAMCPGGVIKNYITVSHSCGGWPGGVS